jgi:hypothetical protein
MEFKIRDFDKNSKLGKTDIIAEKAKFFTNFGEITILANHTNVIITGKLISYTYKSDITEVNLASVFYFDNKKNELLIL